MELRWEYQEEADKKLTTQLSASLNINESLSKLLINRGIRTFDQAKTFFRPSLTDLHDPFLMKDLDHAVNRLTDAVFKGENILIYGDYDVDGTTSVALVYSFLKELTPKISFYIPDRYSEGYGISDKGILWAEANEIDLIIALDCGITAISQAKLAKDKSIDLIICDHHLPGHHLPDALAILDPKRPDCTYPFKELSGCGVGFKLLQGLCIQNTIELQRLFRYLDLLAVSIASDIVPIVDENRTLAYYGMKKINSDPSQGLKALIEISGLKTPLSISDVVFYLGPRINATGRLSHASDSVKLLISRDQEELASFSAQLNTKNNERRNFDKTITQEALAMIESDEQMLHATSTVLFKPDWHKGVVGIVASRCIEHYYRPTIILTESNGKATGSARSVDGFDLYNSISECSDLLDQFGGHKHAAGLTLPVEKVDHFRERFEKVVRREITEDQRIPKLGIDLKISLEFVTFKALNILNQMSPFGPGNLQPVFVSENIMAKNVRKIKEEHLKFVVVDEAGNRSIEAIAFGFGYLAERMEKGEKFSLAYHLDQNEYRGNKTIQLSVKDVKFDA